MQYAFRNVDYCDLLDPLPRKHTTDDNVRYGTRHALYGWHDSGSFGRKRSVYAVAPHLSYGGYCPASRQDSERASLSSGRTDSDAVSLSGSSVDGAHARVVREARDPRHRSRLHALDHRIINKEPDTAIVIPRTQRVQSEQLRVLPPSEFAPLLIEKLERVRREQEAKAALERRLAEGDGEDMSQALSPQLVAAAIREKLQLDHDNVQDILDQHVSRVFSERSPGGSPPGGRRARPRRRPPSTLSADSGHYSHSLPLTRRSFSKKTVTEFTDSGVSVVSEGTSVSAGPSNIEPRILLWMSEGSERVGRRSYLSSRASSAERTHQHPLPQHEERRRPQGAAGGSQRSKASGSKSSGSGTSAGSGDAGAAGAGVAPYTVVVVTFLDENVPYRIKMPAPPLTLRTFKEYLPRKGNYRYFFKTECADFDNTVLHEEISNDSETLPMYEGKVMARVQSID
ncbi:Axin [Eumeta japonica]|uniref:Axin n=1 Tax=Eumeta variegata TaxID=151549 RepID=A0A4C1ZW67_EUMVA|nr:Axin [Eumeta japonica]